MPVGDLMTAMQMKAPENTYFDHLHSEFLTTTALPGAPPAADAAAQVAELAQKRGDGALTWNDIYRFELILADMRPTSTLRGKILNLRHDYLSIAGQAEYEEYLASRPKALLDPPDPNAPPPAQANYDKLLREDLKDLLSRLYLRYAILPVREEKLKHLTLKASFWCGLCLVVLIVFTIIMLIGTKVSGNPATWYIPSISIYVVLAAGALGGFVSALQRIQTSPTEGDSIYNLSMLFHGSYAVFVAPLTGAIFAALLYLMFTGGILKGRFFPDIYTPSAKTVELTQSAANNTNRSGQGNSNAGPSRNANVSDNGNTNSGVNTNRNANGNGNANRGVRANNNTAANANAGANTSAAANANAGTNTNADVAGLTNANSTDNANGREIAGNSNGNPGNSNGGTANSNGAETKASPSPSPTSSPTPTTQQVATESIGIREFLSDSGPAGGTDYALLIIWSFIAGFAERFVPDALNRLVAGKQPDGKPGT